MFLHVLWADVNVRPLPGFVMGVWHTPVIFRKASSQLPASYRSSYLAKTSRTSSAFFVYLSKLRGRNTSCGQSSITVSARYHILIN